MSARAARAEAFARARVRAEALARIRVPRFAKSLAVSAKAKPVFDFDFEAISPAPVTCDGKVFDSEQLLFAHLLARHSANSKGADRAKTDFLLQSVPRLQGVPYVAHFYLAAAAEVGDAAVVAALLARSDWDICPRDASRIIGITLYLSWCLNPGSALFLFLADDRFGLLGGAEAPDQLWSMLHDLPLASAAQVGCVQRLKLLVSQPSLQLGEPTSPGFSLRAGMYQAAAYVAAWHGNARVLDTLLCHLEDLFITAIVLVDDMDNTVWFLRHLLRSDYAEVLRRLVGAHLVMTPKAVDLFLRYGGPRVQELFSAHPVVKERLMGGATWEAVGAHARCPPDEDSYSFPANVPPSALLRGGSKSASARKEVVSPAKPVKSSIFKRVRAAE